MGKDQGRQPAYWLYHRKPAEWVLGRHGTLDEDALYRQARRYDSPVNLIAGIRQDGRLTTIAGQPAAPILLVLAVLRAEGQLPPGFPAIWVEEGDEGSHDVVAV